MASRDIANMHFFLDLKKKFPHLPDELLREHIPLFSEDPEECTRRLQRESERHSALSNPPFSDFRLPDGREEVTPPSATIMRTYRHASSQLPRTECGRTVRLSIAPSAVFFQLRISADPSGAAIGFQHSDESSQAPKNSSAPDPAHILALQNERTVRLLHALEREKSICSRLRQEVRRLQQAAAESAPYAKAVNELREENKRLRTECNCLYIETDMYGSREIPPCETEAFYSEIFTGPNGAILPEAKMESEEWVCEKCTFANHPALEKCEMCEMDRDAFFDGN